MSVKQMAKVWEWSQAEGATLLLMLALADHADDEGYCFPGIPRLAKKCRISERSVQRHLRDLEEIGELKVDLAKGAHCNGGSTNRYRLIVNPDNGEHRRTMAAKGGDNLTPGDKQCQKVVTNRVEGGDKAMSPEPSEPSEETSGVAGAPIEDESSILSKESESEVHLPSELDSDEFVEAWQEWMAYRRERRFKTMTPRFAKAQLAMLAGWGQTKAILSIKQSVAQGWQGIFEYHEKKTSNSNNGSRNAGTFNAGREGRFAGVERLAAKTQPI